MPGIVQRAFMLPPTSQIGPVDPQVRQQMIASSPVHGHYEQTVDRESAYEKLQGKAVQRPTIATIPAAAAAQPAAAGGRRGTTKPEPTAMDQVIKAVNSPMGRQIGRELVRGLMGSLLGSKR
jgi:DNA helicase HerA-like ATPase